MVTTATNLSNRMHLVPCLRSSAVRYPMSLHRHSSTTSLLSRRCTLVELRKPTHFCLISRIYSSASSPEQQSPPMPSSPTTNEGNVPVSVETMPDPQEQQQQQQQSSNNGNSNKNTSNKRRGSNNTSRSAKNNIKKDSWISKGMKNLSLPIRFLINLAMFMLLMRFWPFPSPSSTSSPLANSEGVTLRIAFSEFIKSVRKNEIAHVVVDDKLIVYFLKPTAAMFTKSGALKEFPIDSRKVRFETVRPNDWPTPYETLIANNVAVTAVEKRGMFGTLITYTLIIVVLLAVFNRLQMRFPGQRGQPRRTAPTTSKNGQAEPGMVTFEDVQGADEAKEELEEIVEYLKDPERFIKLGARPPSGVLLVGPPGTGKTLLAKAVAGEAGVPFFSTSASEFVELYVGMGALRVRELFAQARKESPAIVFIDEIDAVAKGRSSQLRSVGNDEREQTLNQLLTELDGFDTQADQMVICIAATNRPDVLDSALLRPGRFDRRVPVERPDRIGREQILKVHIERKEVPLADDIDISALASQTAGFTGADLANVVNEAAILAARGNRDTVTALDFDSAILRSVAGLEKKRSVLKGEEKAVVARHEVGHALVATAVTRLVPTTNPVERLSIIPRSGGALGFTYSPSTEEDRVLLYENDIRGNLAMLMGGRAAESVTSNAVSTGASDDIRRVTDLAYRAVAQYGMSSTVGPLNVAALAGAAGEEYGMIMDSGGDINRAVEREVRLLCESALSAARDVIEENRELHASISKILEQEERLEGATLKEMLEKVVVPTSLERFVVNGELVAGPKSPA